MTTTHSRAESVTLTAVAATMQAADLEMLPDLSAADCAADLQALYNSEINFSISAFWDGGMLFRLGDKVNGYTDENVTWNVREGMAWLVKAAQKRYPQSDFAKARQAKE